MSNDIFEKYSDPSKIGASDYVPDPRRLYDKPIDVIHDETLADAAKRETLTLWAAELDDQLKAEEEGMSAADPMHARKEGALADEAAQVGAALSKLDSR
jgi:hypothetical protein